MGCFCYISVCNEKFAKAVKRIPERAGKLAKKKKKRKMTESYNCEAT